MYVRCRTTFLKNSSLTHCSDRFSLLRIFANVVADSLAPIAAPSDQAVPAEFTIAHIHFKSPVEAEVYSDLLRSGQPAKSFSKTNYHMGAKYGFVHRQFDKSGNGIESTEDNPAGLDFDDDDLYYNTQGAAREYWSAFELPVPAQDITTLRKDMKEWGYCLIKEALSPYQLKAMQDRTADQLEGERLAGVAAWQGRPGGNQSLHAILNKDTPDQIFAKAFCQDPEGVQAGLVIEQILTESIGAGYIGSSMLGIMAHKNSPPQGLHMDQGVQHTGGVQEAPWTCNTMFVLDDFTAENGGTLIVPGSHKLISQVGSGKPVGPLPPAINVECPAGTVVMFEGRLLHGTGVNRTETARRMYVGNSLKSSFRQQEMWALSLHPDVLETASTKLLYRTGLHPTGLGGPEGDWSSEMRYWRKHLEGGTYERVRALTPYEADDYEGYLKDYTWRHAPGGYGHSQQQPSASEHVRKKYIKAPKL